MIRSIPKHGQKFIQHKITHFQSIRKTKKQDEKMEGQLNFLFLG